MDKLDFVKHKDPEDEKDYTQLAKKVSKKREEAFRRNRSKQIERQKFELSKVQTQLQAQNKEVIEKNKYLIQKDNERNKIVKQRRRAIEQELFQRKEIKRLRKENQEYNMNRELAIKNDYKNQLIEKLLEKAQKADRVKDRIKTAATYSVLNMTVI